MSSVGLPVSAKQLVRFMEVSVFPSPIEGLVSSKAAPLLNSLVRLWRKRRNCSAASPRGSVRKTKRDSSAAGKTSFLKPFGELSAAKESHSSVVGAGQLCSGVAVEMLSTANTISRNDVCGLDGERKARLDEVWRSWPSMTVLGIDAILAASSCARRSASWTSLTKIPPSLLRSYVSTASKVPSKQVNLPHDAHQR